jgi:hypothetical protein
MRLHVSAIGLATAIFALMAPSVSVQAARFHDPSLQAPALAEPVACRTVRERVVRPGGAIVFRTKRVCGPGWGGGGGGCKVVRERVHRPGGAVVFRTKRVCG